MSEYHNRRVLLVDDTPAIHEDYRKILSPADASAILELDESILFGKAAAVAPTGFEVESVFQGEQAIAKVRASLEDGSPYAMAFVDMRMPPGLDGVETVEQLWRIDAELQVVLCTAHSDYSWMEVLRRLDIRDRLLILKKPFDPIEGYQFANTLTAKWQVSRQAAFKMDLLKRSVEERTRAQRELQEQLYDEMRQREKMAIELRLAQKLESVGRLAAGIAHEINTPIQDVGDSVYFLQSAPADFKEA